MSHLSRIEIEVNDLRILSAACRRLNLKLNEGQTKFQWYGQESDCQHAIKVPGAAFEIGVLQKGKGYELQCDYYDPEIRRQIGKQGGILKQAYAAEKTKFEARLRGYSVAETITDEKVRIRLTERITT